jgi:prepilin-type N-terminal cleavage/methylation domain-containing protein
MSSRRPAQAFTLLELLVTIGIIAVVLTIALPAISAVRNTARASVCSSNLRQLGIRLESLLIKPGSHLPYFIPGVPASPSTGRGTLADTFPMEEYAGVLLCPTDPRSRLPEAERPESSYRYFPGEKMYEEASKGDLNPARTVSRRYLQFDAYGVFADDEPRHAGRVNTVWLPDGHVFSEEDD